MYNRRGKMDPLWNSLVVGGVEADGTPFLGTVGMIGTHYTDRCRCTARRHLRCFFKPRRWRQLGGEASDPAAAQLRASGSPAAPSP